MGGVQQQQVMVIETEGGVERKNWRDAPGGKQRGNWQVLVVIKDGQPAPNHEKRVEQREERQPLPRRENQVLAHAFPILQDYCQREPNGEYEPRAEPKGWNGRQQPAGKICQPDLQHQPQAQPEQRGFMPLGFDGVDENQKSAGGPERGPEQNR